MFNQGGEIIRAVSTYTCSICLIDSHTIRACTREVQSTLIRKSHAVCLAATFPWRDWPLSETKHPDHLLVVFHCIKWSRSHRISTSPLGGNSIIVSKYLFMYTTA